MKCLSSKGPITGAEALRWAVHIFVEKGLDFSTAHFEGRMLLEKAWDKKGIKLVLALDENLEKAVWEEYEKLVERRANHEPLQYLLGEQEFMGLLFEVSPGVLIPRWDTEVLVNETLTLAKTLPGQAETTETVRILDLGTGSGVIAICLAHFLPRAQVVAVDISPEALVVARSNARKHGVEKRIVFLEGDLFAPLPRGDKYRFIVSNPPYISREEYYSLEPEVKKEPYQALYGGTDGLEYYRRIANAAPGYLVQGGYLLLEIGWLQGEPVRELLERQSFEDIRIVRDCSGKDRVVVARKR